MSYALSPLPWKKRWVYRWIHVHEYFSLTCCLLNVCSHLWYNGSVNSKHAHSSRALDWQMVIRWQFTIPSYSTLLHVHVESKHEFMGVVVKHELVPRGKWIYNHVPYEGLIPLIFNRVGLHSYKVLIYNSLFLTKWPNAIPLGTLISKCPMVGTNNLSNARPMSGGDGQVWNNYW